MRSFQTSETPYTHIWHKYRPVILRLMVNAADSPQHYVLSPHEFRQMFPKYQTSLAFILYIHRSKALNNIRTSDLAGALLKVLQQSETAMRLTHDSTYELLLDHNFVFHVRKNENTDPAIAASTTVASMNEIIKEATK